MIAVGVIDLKDMNTIKLRSENCGVFAFYKLNYFNIGGYCQKDYPIINLKLYIYFIKSVFLFPNGGKYIMKNKFKKALQAAVILSCATLFPWQAMAAEVEEVEEVEYETSSTDFNYGDETYFTAEVVDAGQKTENGISRELEDDELEAFENQAVAYLGDITGAPISLSPTISLMPLDIKDANASAESEVDGETGLTKYASYFIGSGVSEESDEAAAEVTVNLAPEVYVCGKLYLCSGNQ